jgi:hypothetical protein
VLPLLRNDASGEGFVAEVEDLVAIAEAGIEEPLVEATIARGFKYDAWLAPERRVDLIQVGRFFVGARWWYSKVCLLHALTLRAAASNDSFASNLIRSAATTPNENPFVNEAARQCTLALDARAAKRWGWRTNPWSSNMRTRVLRLAMERSTPALFSSPWRSRSR